MTDDEAELVKVEDLECGTEHGVYDFLARLPRQALVDESAMARGLGVVPRTVRRMVARHELPPSLGKMGGRSVWIAGRVLDHLETRAEQAEKKAERAAARLRQINP